MRHPQIQRKTVNIASPTLPGCVMDEPGLFAQPYAPRKGLGWNNEK